MLLLVNLLIFPQWLREYILFPLLCPHTAFHFAEWLLLEPRLWRPRPALTVCGRGLPTIHTNYYLLPKTTVDWLQLWVLIFRTFVLYTLTENCIGGSDLLQSDHVSNEAVSTDWFFPLNWLPFKASKTDFPHCGSSAFLSIGHASSSWKPLTAFCLHPRQKPLRMW